MSIDFNIGFSIVCVCLFIALVTLIVSFGGCETIEEDLHLTAHSNESSVVEDVGLTARSSEGTVVENPAHNV